MAHKCGECGSADTSTGLHSFTCLDCGAVTAYTSPEGKGRVPNPDGPATYADAAVYEGGGGLPLSPPDKAKAPAKKKK